MKFNGKKLCILAVCTAACIGLLCAGYYTDIFGLVFFTALLMLSLIFVRATMGTPALLVSLTAVGVTGYFICGINYAAAYFTTAAIISFACGYAVISQKSFYDSLLMCCVSCALALGVIMLFLWARTGQSLIDAAISKTQAMFAAMPDDALKFLYRYVSVAASGNTPEISSFSKAALSAVSANTALNGIMRYVTPSITLLVAQLCPIGVLFSGLMYYIVPRAVLKKLKYMVLDIPAFSMWSLPGHFGIWSVVIFMVALIGYISGWSNFEIVYGIVYGAFNFLYTVQGLAFCDWLLLKKIDSTSARVAILAVSYFIASIIDLFMWLGLVEQILKIRKRKALNF